VLAEEAHVPELLEQFRAQVVAPRRALLRAVLERARERGELAPGADLDAAVAALVGSLYAAYLAAGRIPHGLEERVVDVVLDGIAAASE
jgi:hypothetical protein